MTAPSRSTAEQAMAALIHALRPDWATPGILAVIRRDPARPLDQIAAAAIYATTRRDQHSPHLIGEDDGEALDRLTGRAAGPATPQPTRGCWYHPGQPRECPDCAADARIASKRASDHIAEIRATIRANREDRS